MTELEVFLLFLLACSILGHAWVLILYQNVRIDKHLLERGWKIERELSYDGSYTVYRKYTEYHTDLYGKPIKIELFSRRKAHKHQKLIDMHKDLKTGLEDAIAVPVESNAELAVKRAATSGTWKDD